MLHLMSLKACFKTVYPNTVQLLFKLIKNYIKIQYPNKKYHVALISLYV